MLWCQGERGESSDNRWSDYIGYIGYKSSQYRKLERREKIAGVLLNIIDVDPTAHNSSICRIIIALVKAYVNWLKRAKINFMNLGFWGKLNKPIMALAPMADVTDMAFREMFARYGKPDVMFTEFVSVDGLISAGQKNLMRELAFSEAQRPIVAQIWGRDPKKYFLSAQIIAKLGFDGIDINMGCPQRKEISLGTCAALIRNHDLAKEIIRQTKLGAGKLPVSVKTRIGYNTIETEDWVGFLLDQDLAAIILHARTKQEMSKVPAHWNEITKAVNLRNRRGSGTLILGNGDIKTLAEAREKSKQTGADGVMIGRGAFGKPWFFDNRLSEEEIPIEKRLKVMTEHSELFEKVFNSPSPQSSPTRGEEIKRKNFSVMKKHFKAYVSGFSGASELRAKLMNTNSSENAAEIVRSFFV